jgi:hypothetical protein
VWPFQTEKKMYTKSLRQTEIHKGLLDSAVKSE